MNAPRFMAHDAVDNIEVVPASEYDALKAKVDSAVEMLDRDPAYRDVCGAIELLRGALT